MLVESEMQNESRCGSLEPRKTFYIYIYIVISVKFLAATYDRQELKPCSQKMDQIYLQPSVSYLAMFYHRTFTEGDACFPIPHTHLIILYHASPACVLPYVFMISSFI